MSAAVIEEKRGQLARKVQRWRLTQAAYMPSVAVLLQALTASGNPEFDSLFLPSYLTDAQRLELPRAHHLADKERRLRLAQAEDALSSLKKALGVRHAVYGLKKTNVVGQKECTRARSLLNALNEKISLTADRYRAAWTALGQLDPGGSWDDRLQELLPKHVKGPTGADDDGKPQDPLGDGKRTLPWIWATVLNNEELAGPDDHSELDQTW